MKALTLLIWFCWAAICARVLAAPFVHLSLPEGLFLFVVCAPAVGAMSWIRWMLRQKRAATGTTAAGFWDDDGPARSERPEGEQRGVVGQLF